MPQNKMFLLKQNGEVILEADEYAVREKIEELLEARVGMFVSLQEMVDEDDDTYEFYLHSDNDEDLSDEQLTVLNDEYGINTHDDESSESAIKGLLNIEVVVKAA